LNQENSQGLLPYLILQNQENETLALALMPPLLRMYIPQKEAKEAQI
jgi:hypothetical protein